MTILYDVVSLLRVFPSIGANLEPYSKKENGEKAITSAPNRVLHLTAETSSQRGLAARTVFCL